MCLHSVTIYEQPTTKARRAYKILEGNLSPFQHAHYPLGVWLEARPNNIRHDGKLHTVGDGLNISIYEAGFHSYPTRKEARAALTFFKKERHSHRNWRVVQVEVRGITSEGLDGTSFYPEFKKLKLRNLVSREIRLVNKKA